MLSRRHLLASALATPAAAADSPVRLPKRIRLAIIGFEGHPGEVTGPLPRLPDVEVIAIADFDAAVLQREARRPRLAAAVKYADYRQMLERERPDVVAVCNTNGERAAAVLAALKRGLHVIAEKPLATRRSDYNEIKSAVARQGVKLGQLLPMRFSSPFLAMRDLVRAGAIGEVAQMDSQKSYRVGDRDSWYFKRASYGGTILWIGIHMIDLMRFTSGREFRQAGGFQGHVGFPRIGDMENVTVSMFRLDNGGTASLRMDYLRTPSSPTSSDARLRLAGTRGILEYREKDGLTLMTIDRKPEAVTDLPPRGQVFIDFLEHVYASKPTQLPLDDIWRANEATIAAHEAAAEGRIVGV
ncbi:MAG: Gfo/Idh/MocA family oxidoreductase [Acidobacteria bacterium]|nr:Gfo/Idh/MocA family oxidoreductase [Acidobacteriota bacterium]